MPNVLTAAFLLLVVWLPQQPVSPRVRGSVKDAAAVNVLCVAAWENLKFLDPRSLDREDRQEFDRIGDLLGRARSAVKNRSHGGEFPGAHAMAHEALTRADALVRKCLKIDAYHNLAERYRSGDTTAIVALSGWIAADLERLTHYLEAGGVRGTSGPGQANSPVVGDFTSQILATCVLLHTQVAFDSPQPQPHLGMARRLLNLLDDGGLPAAFRRDWFLAVAAHLQGQLDIAEAMVHLDDALTQFPRDGDVLLAAGALFELLASPSVDLPLSPAVPPASGLTAMGNTRSAAVRRQLADVRQDRAAGLSRAESLYRQAIAVNPALAEAHLRLGRVLHLSGHRDASLVEIRQAAASDDKRIRYLAALFEGVVHESGGQVDEAVSDYRIAARTCPDCLTGGVALSHAFRKNGDFEAARATLDAVLARDKRVLADDPWWYYPLGGFWRRDRMLADLRASLGKQQ